MFQFFVRIVFSKFLLFLSMMKKHSKPTKMKSFNKFKQKKSEKVQMETSQQNKLEKNAAI